MEADCRRHGGVRSKRCAEHERHALTDGLFWIDEATDWLIDSGVDEIVLVVTGGVLSALWSRGAGAPVVRVRATGAGALA